jgi:ADP-ribose pyrophosphatase YjhB (NUDIX family)
MPDHRIDVASTAMRFGATFEARRYVMQQASLFVLAVVPLEIARRPGVEARYLIVEERDGTFYLPAGKVEQGENLVAAVVRETIEEAKQLIGVRGLLAVDHEVRGDRLRLRFVFVGYPGVVLPTKTEPDEHSRSAAYMTHAEIAKLPLRHPEVLDLIDAYESGRALMPTGAYDFGQRAASAAC